MMFYAFLYAYPAYRSIRMVAVPIRRGLQALLHGIRRLPVEFAADFFAIHTQRAEQTLHLPCLAEKSAAQFQQPGWQWK